MWVLLDGAGATTGGNDGKLMLPPIMLLIDQ